MTIFGNAAKKSAAAFLLFAVIVSLAFIAACSTYADQTPQGNQALPVPEFPLNKASVTDALQESGLPWTARDTVFPDGSTRQDENVLDFTLYRDTSQIGFLSSAMIGGERRASIAFLNYFGESPYMDVHNPPREDWESIIVFFTLLYGGFESAHQVFRYFDSEVEAIPRQTMESPRFEEGALWERVINDAYFRIVLVRPVGSSDEYFMSISVFSDWDLFGPLEAQALAETPDEIEPEPELEWWEILLRYPPEPIAHEFWLDENSITEAIQKSGLPWTASPAPGFMDSILEGSYILYNGTTQLGYIRNVVIDGERSLHGLFLHYQWDRPALFVDIHTQSREDWDDYIVLFTNMFGGFESAYQILDYFNDEIDYIERRVPEPLSTFIGDYAIWEREINDIHVIITIARYYGRAEEHMSTIFMFTDWYTFGN